MMKILRNFMLVGLLCLSGALTACLPDEQDPAAVSDAGKLNGSYYAAGLGNLALQIQNLVVSDASWFSSTVTSGALDLAALKLHSDSLGVEVKSNICLTGNGTAVKQITWLDGRDAGGKFSIKGMGAEAGTIVSALRNRIAADQVGVYSSQNKIDLTDGAALSIPSSCSGISIPKGAPVVVFTIARPAAPTTDLARTEYKTEECPVDANGIKKRGTRVKKRVLTYKTDGTIEEGAWAFESMGQCLVDNVVEITERNLQQGGNTADLTNFANVALRNLLAQQLKMDCTTTTIQSSNKNGNKEKTIDTCAQIVGGTEKQVISDEETGENEDNRILKCAGSTSFTASPFINLLGPGTSTTRWLSGEATVVRVITQHTTSEDSQDTQRSYWEGKTIDCKGDQDFNVSCSNIRGALNVVLRASDDKYVIEQLTGTGWLNRSWLERKLGCWIGSCTEVIYAETVALNEDYFTGVSQLENVGTRAGRDMEATSWLNKVAFTPAATPTTPWVIEENKCLWSETVMTIQCPLEYDTSRQGDWDTAIDPSDGMPIAVKPGISSDGSIGSLIYNEAKQIDENIAEVMTIWRKCNIKGCRTWPEFSGPRVERTLNINCNVKGCWDVMHAYNGKTVGPIKRSYALNNTTDSLLGPSTVVETIRPTYIKAWTDMPDYNGVWISMTARTLRAEMCTNLAFQLDEGGGLQEAIDASEAANANAAQKQEEYDAAIVELNNAEAVLVDKQAAAEIAETISPEAHAEALLEVTAAEEVVAEKEANVAAKEDELETALEAAALAQAEVEEILANASAPVGGELTAEQYEMAADVYQKICTTQNSTLTSNESVDTQAICELNLESPALLQHISALSNYCDAVFDPNESNNGLTFKPRSTVGEGTRVQTTLLNTDGVKIAHRPALVDNRNLTVRNDGFVEPLQCARHEETSQDWPLRWYFRSCNFIKGCSWKYIDATTPVTVSNVREWSGYSLATGTWSKPVSRAYTVYGAWDKLEDIPAMIVINGPNPSPIPYPKPYTGAPSLPAPPPPPPFVDPCVPVDNCR